eukprot:TRINITY_DN41493_c0_g1_i1.p1 TRINITY_DN41493_c0_g1~~TRINITY_DN41493_c0_g1_i1.p1  ORF type:complete len:114 (-),score=12.74 TRINITY_DN41493_c0_g1_i1:172-513(-)
MYDRCVNKYNFNNPEHLACTEIRRANLANCGFGVYMQQDGANFGVRKEHANCVKLVATKALIHQRFMDKDLAQYSVDKVFSKCYQDLEPIGRRAKDAADILRAFEEKFLFGYH